MAGKNVFTFALFGIMGASVMVNSWVLQTNLLPPTTPPPWATTFPPGCQTNGEQLFPGQEITFFHDGGCQLCECSYDGHLSCYVADCLVPMCTNAHKPHRACCAVCPNGRNCRVPMTGDVIQAGPPVEIGGMLCECPPQNYMLPGIQSEADYTAICIPITTIPPTTTTPDVPVGRR